MSLPPDVPSDRIGVDAIPSNWTFENSQVAKGFQRHVRETLPWYDLATGVVAHLARHYIPDGGVVYDIGASVGNIGNILRPTLEARKAKFTPIESSAEMCKLYAGPGEVVHTDAMEFKYEQFDCAILFLVMMFMPAATRVDWLKELAKKIKPGGCIIVFDKFLMDGNPYVATALRRLTMAGKVSTGMGSDEIVAKELSLEGVQRPLPMSLFRYLSPYPVPVFQFGEFSGFILERTEFGPG